MQKRVKRILALAGYAPKFGLPTKSDRILVWGHRKTAKRGVWVANRTETPVIRIEDAFLRSPRTGRDGDLPLGLLIDHNGCHFDCSRPSDLEILLSTHSLSDPDLLERARHGMDRISEHQLTKYSGNPTDGPAPAPGYVLVIDQTFGDASIPLAGASPETFQAMLAEARQDHPNAKILIKSHPETKSGHRKGHFSAADLDSVTEFWTDPIPPQRLFAGAEAVYVVSSQLGAEAIWHGHTPVVYGAPFYAGWGLTHDRGPKIERRNRTLSPEQLFAAAMILAPTWYDPCRDALCDFETALSQLEVDTRVWREDHKGWDAHGMRLWKRKPLQKFFGTYKPMTFEARKPKAEIPKMVWGIKDGPDGSVRVEDGFLRSRGLGADLVPPLSLILDRLGIYFDPNQPSDMEKAIAKREVLTEWQSQRAEELRQHLIEARITKYNLDRSENQSLPSGHKILVPGQVEDDASILRGTEDICTNEDLLRHTRAKNPEAFIIYKPHPDVEAGLRKGAIGTASDYADYVANSADPVALIEQVDAVWTMTSLLGFEALIRGKPVTCLGLPFYAGWGLTQDHLSVDRRTARPSLQGLIHAALIDMPRYYDPVSGLPCPAEVAVARLKDGVGMKRGSVNRLASKLQGALASFAYLWR